MALTRREQAAFELIVEQLRAEDPMRGVADADAGSVGQPLRCWF